MVFPNSRTGCSRVPPQSATLTPQYCYLGDPVRLACLIHAASVRSEPESNSQKKKVFSLKVPRGTFVAPHTNNYCSVSLPKVRIYFNEPSRVTSQASILKDQSPAFSLSLSARSFTLSGERGHSLSNLFPTRKGVFYFFYFIWGITKKLDYEISASFLRRA